jgi:formylglycine-generating enzyme
VISAASISAAAVPASAGRAGTSLGPDAVGASMIWIPGDDFVMGSNRFYREERPARPASVDGFWIDPHPVTNA